MDTTDKDRMHGEEVTIYQYIRSRKRQRTRTIMHILDGNGQLQTDQDDIMRIFTNFLVTKYEHLHIDVSSLRKITSCGMPKIPASVNTEVDKTITMEELLVAVKEGKQHKSPGHDGICNEFFKRMWDVVKRDMLEVINHTCMEGSVSDAQKHGSIICLPKIK